MHLKEIGVRISFNALILIEVNFTKSKEEKKRSSFGLAFFWPRLNSILKYLVCLRMHFM